MGSGRPGDQPLPTKNESPYIQDLIQAELDTLASKGTDLRAEIASLKLTLEERTRLGEQRYGVPGLQANNGRDMLRDAFEEIVDAFVYLRAYVEETGNEEDRDVYRVILGEALVLQRRMDERSKECAGGCGKLVKISPGVTTVCSMSCSNKLSAAWRLSVQEADDGS